MKDITNWRIYCHACGSGCNQSARAVKVCGFCGSKNIRKTNETPKPPTAREGPRIGDSAESAKRRRALRDSRAADPPYPSAGGPSKGTGDKT